ncbi:MAG: hypothetical protein HYU77_09210 [Betaproteobacteria bacterium]|nr:hypothetical protein [Betaproteobacteria bacterium]
MIIRLCRKSIITLRPGDALRCRFTLLEARPSRSKPGQGIATFRYEVVNGGGEPVLSFKMTQALKRRPPG